MVKHTGGARAALRARLFAAALFVPFLASGPAKALDLDTVVAERDGEQLTVGEIDAEIRSMPPDMRGSFMADPQRTGELIDRMLLKQQLARRAIANGLHEDPALLADLERLRTEMLAARQTQKHIQGVAIPNFEQLAHERYLSDPGKFAPPSRIDLRHVLVSTDGHDDEKSKELAQAIFDRAKGGEDLVAIAEELIEREGKWVHTQLLERADASRMDVNFVKAMSTLGKPGDLAGPVRSRFGWHVIRLEKYETYPPPPYDEVKPKLVEELRGKYLSDERNRYLATLTHEETRLEHEVIAQLAERYAAQARADAANGSAAEVSVPLIPQQ